MDYKHLISRREQTLGLFILPVSLLSIALLVTSATYALVKLIDKTITTVVNLAAVNFDMSHMQFFNFDTFFFNLQTHTFVGYLGLIITIGLLIYAKRISNVEKKSLPEYIYFIVAYWVLYAYWWIISIYQILFDKNRSWGHKSNKI